MPAGRRVGYVVSAELLTQCDRLPAVRQRASMVHRLLHACQLLPRMTLLPAQTADADQVASFHSRDYVDTLASCDNAEWDELTQFGLELDCALLPDCWRLVRVLAGASLTAAAALNERRVDVAVNWCGGWHHARRDSAAGFCYVNDCVLAIERLLNTHSRVIYVDLDVHHGDGVQEAFYHSSRVITVSLHHRAVGFYPGGGDWTETGAGRGILHSINVPLRQGAGDATLLSVVEAVVGGLKRVLPLLDSVALVCQCGADCLARDPLGEFSATAQGVAGCVQPFLDLQLPTLLMGGGGYNAANTARCWTAITARLLNTPLPADVPEHAFFTRYGPGFEMDTLPGARRDLNKGEYLAETVRRIEAHFEQLAACYDAENQTDSERCQ